MAALGCLAAALLAAVVTGPVVAEDPEPPSQPAITSAATVGERLTGRVYIWDQGRLRPASQAKVSTGSALVRTDSSGRFEFAAEQRTGSLTIIQPGYDVVRRPIYYDESVIILRSIVVRAIHIPFSEVAKPSVQSFVHDLVDADLINSVVIDIKEEAGRVVSFAATPLAEQIEADRDGAPLAAFLEELKNKGVYRIGRVVTFLDDRYASWFPEESLHRFDGGLFRDSMGLAWSSVYSSQTRQYNIDIAVAAAGYVEEIQFDYVRLPYENGLRERFQYTAAERVGAVTGFAREASEAIHLAGMAVSFDTFGVVSTAGDDQGIGQSIDRLGRYLDYISPMVYPSGWPPGSFGYSYPPAVPGPIVRINVQATIDSIPEDGSALVRPWLQDFRDYQSQGLYYGWDRVHAQIEATAAAGGNGFMLWDPSMQYQLIALERALSLDWTPLD